MPLAQLALSAVWRGDDDCERVLGELNQVTTGQPSGILGVLVEATKRWALGSHDALTGRPAAALHHFEQMTQRTLTRLAAYDRLDIAIRAGQRDTAIGWLTDLERFADAVDTPHARAVVAYSRALLASGKNSSGTAEELSSRRCVIRLVRVGPSNGPAGTWPTAISCADSAAGLTPASSCGPCCRRLTISARPRGRTGPGRAAGLR